MPGGLCAKRPGKRVGCEDCLGSTLFSITKPQPSAIAQAHDKDKAQGGRTPRIPRPGLPGPSICAGLAGRERSKGPHQYVPRYPRTLLPRLPGLSRGYPPAQGRRQDGARYRAMLGLARPRAIPLVGY